MLCVLSDYLYLPSTERPMSNICHLSKNRTETVEDQYNHKAHSKRNNLLMINPFSQFVLSIYWILSTNSKTDRLIAYLSRYICQ